MKKKTEVEYAEWVKEVESSLPDTLKGNWKSLAEAKEGFDLFNGHLRQKEFDRLQNEIKTSQRAVEADRAAIGEAMQKFVSEVQQVKEWFDTEAPKNSQLVSAYQQLGSRYQKAQAKLRELGLEDDDSRPLGNEVPVSMPQSNASAEELAEIRKQLNLQNRVIPKILADLGSVMKEGLKNNFEFDPHAVMDYANRNNVDLKQAFNALTADQRQERQEKQQADAIEKAREEGRRETLSKIHSPERLSPAGPSPMDGLFNGSKAPDSRERVSNAAKSWLETGGNLTSF